MFACGPGSMNCGHVAPRCERRHASEGHVPSLVKRFHEEVQTVALVSDSKGLRHTYPMICPFDSKLLLRDLQVVCFRGPS